MTPPRSPAGAAAAPGGEDASLAVLALALRPTAAVLQDAFLTPPQLAEATVQLGEGPVGWALEQAAGSLTLVERAFAALPDLPRSDIGLSLESLVLDLLAAWAHRPGRSFSRRFVPPMARTAARLQVPFETVITSMRDTQARLVSAMFTAAGPEGLAPAAAAAMVSAASRVFDAEIGRFLVAYLGEREAVVESRLTRRRDLVTALLGDRPPADLAGAEHDLGVDLSRLHTGAVITRNDGAPSLETRRIARVLQDAFPRGHVLVVPAGDNRVWAWVSTAEEPDSAARALLGEALASIHGCTSAVGAALPGWSGFRESHEQASDTALLAANSVPDQQVLLWHEHALATLLAADVGRARRLVQSVLGPMSQDTETAREQRLTLQAYLESGRSLARAAQQRSVHRNTVVYRLQRVEEVLGHPIGDRDLELRCALLLAATLGPAVLA